MLWVEFEPTIPLFERAKTVHALDRAVTMIGPNNTRYCINQEGPRCISLPLASYLKGPNIFPRVVHEQFMLFPQSKKQYSTFIQKVKEGFIINKARWAYQPILLTRFRGIVFREFTGRNSQVATCPTHSNARPVTVLPHEQWLRSDEPHLKVMRWTPWRVIRKVIIIMATQLRPEYYTMRLDGRTQRKHDLHRSYVRVHVGFTVLYRCSNLLANVTTQFHTKVQELLKSAMR
jgi:hypothetical protein